MADMSSTNTLFATEVGADVNKLFTLITGAASIASLVNLKTNTKANLVAALNELFDAVDAAASSGGASINDNAPSGVTTYSSNKIETVSTAKAAAIVSDGTTGNGTTWSSTKINNAIGNIATQVQTILSGSSAAYDTFKEVSDYIAADQTGTAGILASIQNRLQLDAAQTFNATQLTNGLANLVTLGVAKQSDLQALITAVGDTTVNLRTVYRAARDA